MPIAVINDLQHLLVDLNLQINARVAAALFNAIIFFSP
jgi:hypothetical protein